MSPEKKLKLREAFIKQGGSDIQELSLCIENKDKKGVSHLVHRLCGSSVFMGADKIEKLCKSIELGIKLNSWQDIEDAYFKLKQSFNIFRINEGDFVAIILEDDMVVAEALENSIKEGVSNAVVLIFNDVYDVLTLDNVAPDVILLDHFIGLTRGIEKIPEFINKWPAVSIAVVSAQKDVKNFSLAYQYGAKTYFSKTPQALEQISKFVSKVNLNKTAEEESNFYQEFLNLFDFNIKSRKNVAIIEDNDVAAFSLQYCLDSDPGLSVSIFVDLFHFLDNPSNLKFDVIILDLNFENCQVHAHEIEKIKQLHPKSSIIVLSVNDNLSWAEEVKNSGVDHYIVKSLTGLGRVKELVLSN